MGVNHTLLYFQFFGDQSYELHFTDEDDGGNSIFIIVLSGALSGGVVIVIIGGGICLLVIILVKKTRTRLNGMSIPYSILSPMYIHFIWQ